MTKLNTIGITLVTSATLVVIALMVASLGGSYALATSALPEHFTQLYFKNPKTLPPDITVKRPLTIAFGITNNEGIAQTYAYSETLTTNGTRVSQTRRSVVIASGQSKNIPVTFTADKPGEILVLTVELTAQHQTIEFRTKS